METKHAMGSNITIKLDDIKVCYDDMGEGAIPILFIHGFPFDKSSWQPQMGVLKKRYRVIAYDIRGFGKSGANGKKLSIELFADDLIRFMDALKISKAIVCGLSMGGYILLNAVYRYPERFEAVILSDTQCLADTPELKEKRNQTISKITTRGLKEYAEAFSTAVFCKETLEVKKELVEKIKKVILSTSPLTVVGTLTALAQRSEMCSTLNKISVSTLILCGTEDAVTPFLQSEYMHKNISNSKLYGIEKAGHLSNLEQADEFNRHITDFILSLES